MRVWLLLLLVLVVVGMPAPAAAQQPGCVAPKQLGLALVFDDSGSMSSNDPDELRVEGTRVALDLLPDNSIAAAGSFDSNAREFFGPSVVDDASRDRLKGEVFGAASGSTDFDLGFDQLLGQLDAMPASVDRKAVVFLSDGKDNDGNYSSDDSIASRGVPIFTVAFGDADRDALREIAEGDGRSGKAYDAEDSQGLQAALSDIVNVLACRAPKTSTSVTLQPGETREFPFQIKPSDRGWQGLVSWAEGSFDVTARRPDGSTFDAAGKQPPETYDAQAFRAVLASRQPLAGSWTLRVTARSTNTAAADVDIRIFDSEEGSAIIGVSSPKKKLPFLLPSKSPLSTIKSLAGVPIHVYLQPAVGFGAKVSEGIQLPESIADPEKTYKIFNPNDPTKAWEFSVAEFGWKGPGLELGPFNVQGPRFKPELDVEDPLNAGLLGQALVLKLGPAASVRYTQEFPVAPRYAALELEADLDLKAGAFVIDVVPWAAVRAAAALGAGAVTGGTGTAAVTGVVVSAASAQWIAEATLAALYLTRVLKVVIKAHDVVQNLSGSARLLVEQVMPLIVAEVRKLLAKAVRAVGDASRAAISRAAGAGNRLLGIFGFSSALRTAQAAAVYTRPAPLSARRLSGRPRFRQPAMARTRVRRSIAAANRYAPSNPVRARRLLVAGTLAPGKTAKVAVKFPRLRKAARDRVAVLSLTRDRGRTFERQLRISGGITGATVKLPRRLAKGTWQLAITDYGATGVPTGRVEMALAEFRVK